MNTAKVLLDNDESNPNFGGVLARLLPRQNGTPAGVNALAESIKRGNAYVEAQQRINDVCLPVKTQLSNDLIIKEA